MNRPLPVVLSIALLAGCQMTPGTKAATTLGGIGLATLGVFVAQPTEIDSNHDGVNGTILNDDFSGFVPGLLMVMAGTAMALAGLSASTPPEQIVVVAPPVAAAPASVIYTGPPAYDAPGSPAILPELPVTEATLILGKQVRSAAANGRCEHAWLMWRRINEQDARYAAALITSDVMAPCRR
ncbi:hypothetical protein BH11MYX3_BH11MYX3_49400 [soil metagenome]